ncbi:glycosyltransferase, partial [Candidatus Uhrbacteria bacterium]|nr:glycosyltransferase [Candidatus Uhrbacteria bacterium]
MIAIDVRALCTREPSGVPHALFEILDAWPESAHKTVLFSSGAVPPDLPVSLARHSNVRRIHVRAPNKVINALIASGACSLERLYRVTPHVVWFPNTGFLPRTKARTVVTVHDLAFHFFPDTYTLFQHARYRITRARSSMSHADAIIAISQSTARDVRALGAQAPIHIIPHGINIAQFTSVVRPEDTRTLEQLGVQKPYVLFLATCEPRKNLPSLVEAFDRIAHAHPRLLLVIAGGHGWKRRVLDKTIASAAYRARIRQIGFVKDDVRATL